MAKGQAPAYQAATVVNGPESGKDRWSSIGVAFQDMTSITVLLDAVPVNGRIVLTKPKQKAA